MMAIHVVVFDLGLQSHIGCLVSAWLGIGMGFGDMCIGVAILVLFVLVGAC
jgi:hypothetical protein